MGNRFDNVAHQFCEYIKEIACKEQNFYNFESYLSRHFGSWLKEYANTPMVI